MSRTRREGVGIEPTVEQSTAQPIGFEGRDAHQSHMPPALKNANFNKERV